MHRTTVSFGDSDWKKLRKMALDQRISVSQLITLAVARLKSQSVGKPRSWEFNWKPRAMGKANGDFKTREGIYEFSHRL